MICNHFNGIQQPVGNETRVTFSALTACEMQGYQASTFSIKYVVEGTEHYFLDNRRFAVSAGNFLLVNGQRPLDVEVRSKKEVIGFCIHLQPRLLQETYRHLVCAPEVLLDEPFRDCALPEFEELIYSDEENELGGALRQLHSSFDRHSVSIGVEGTELFHVLASRMLALEEPSLLNGKNLKALRSRTKKELLRRLAIAVELMETDLSAPLNIDRIAKGAMLSGSHFLHSFRKVYGISPYQYLLKRKLEKAFTQITQHHMPVGEAALACGFADGSALTKAFKKEFGKAPSHFLKENGPPCNN